MSLYEYCGENYVGVYDWDDDTFLHVYPNPTRGVINISSILPTITTVYNSVGEVIVDQSASEKIDISASANGVYFVQVMLGKRVHCERIIKR